MVASSVVKKMVTRGTDRIFPLNISEVQAILRHVVKGLTQVEIWIDPTLEGLAVGAGGRNVLRARKCPGVEMIMWGPPGHFDVWGRKDEQVAEAERLLTMERTTLDLPRGQEHTVQQFRTEFQKELIKETGEVRVYPRDDKIELTGTRPSVWRARRWFEKGWQPPAANTGQVKPRAGPGAKEPTVYGSMRLLEKGLRDSLPTLLRQAGWRRDTMSPMHREECALANSAVCRQLCGHPVVQHRPGLQEEGVLLRVDWNGRSLVQVDRDLICSIESSSTSICQNPLFMSARLK